jgi:hypothetical protein
MSISRREARRRLVSRWHEQKATLPPGLLLLFTLWHFLTEENIAAVQALNLSESYSERRDREMIEAWYRRDDGRARQ